MILEILGLYFRFCITHKHILIQGLGKLYTEVFRKKVEFCADWPDRHKGRVPLPNRMNFWKKSKHAFFKVCLVLIFHNTIFEEKKT